MQIIFPPDFMEQAEEAITVDILSPLAPVTKSRLWLRDSSCLTPRKSFAVHEFHCMYFCLKGEGYIEIDGIPHLIRENEALGVLPRQPHRRKNTEKEVLFLLLRFETRPELFSSLFGYTLSFSEELFPYIQDTVDSYGKLFSENNVQNRNEFGLKAALLLNRLSSSARSEFSFQAINSQRLSEAMQLLTSPGSMGLQLREIASQLGITPGHLTDLVHDGLGYSPRHIKRYLRHRIAAEHLLHTSLSISEIAEKNGFKSVYAFSRFFKNVTGFSPTAFRKIHRSDHDLPE